MAASLTALTLVALMVGVAPSAPGAVAPPAADSLAAAAPAPVDSAAAARHAVADSSAAATDRAVRRAAADSLAARRIVRTFPPVEVWALLDDLGASQVVHPIPAAAVRSFPVGSLAELIALQPGVVAQAEELHVRGGRSGETVMSLDGVTLDEPRRRRSMEVPLLALESAQLVSGAPDAQYGGGLAGVVDLRTVNPGAHPSGEWRWDTDGRRGTHYDRVAARAGTPLPLGGLGVVAAGDATLDDTPLPVTHTVGRRDLAGLSLGWRASDRVLGFVKLAPVRQPERFSAQVLFSRTLDLPYNPSWSLDGWVLVPDNLKTSPTFSPVPLPGYQRFVAADHLALTDERRLVALLRTAAVRGATRGSLTLGWERTSSTTSIGGRRDRDNAVTRPRYGRSADRDGYFALWGDYPLYQESDSDVLTLRGDTETRTPGGATLGTGAGLTYEDVRLFEDDRMPYGDHAFEPDATFPVDSIRAYHAKAPGGFAYVQGRWSSGGMLVHAGLRAEYFTAGPEGTRQTLPGGTGGVWSFGPRLGFAYPISVHDAFSLAYVRMQQAPGRDYLYDTRTSISDRQPLGNPAIQPATLISYEAAVKHLFGPTWALQTSVFFRDVFGQVGALDYQIPNGAANLRYSDSDQSHALGFELSVVHAGPRGRMEAHYTWMNAYGNESRPEGDPYGPVRAATLPPITDTPLSWDRRHTFQLSGAWQGPRHTTVGWSSTVGSPLPWTPKALRQTLTDLGQVNSGRLGWSEVTDLDVRWAPPQARGLSIGLQVRDLFDDRYERAVSVDGYPNPVINTLYDDYAAYRAATGLPGGAYWSQLPGDPGHWVPVNDPRLFAPAREVRLSIAGRW